MWSLRPVLVQGNDTRHHRGTRDRINQVQAACIGRARFVVALPRLVRGPLRIQELQQAGLPALIRILYGVTYIPGPLQHVGLSPLYYLLGRGVLLVGSLYFLADVRFQGTQLDRELLLLLARALDFPLVAIEDR